MTTTGGTQMVDTQSDALRTLHRVFGYEAFRGGQGEIIEHVVGGRRRPGADADRRRQVALLPDPRAGACRRRRRHLPAHRPHAGPGRRAAGPRRAGRVPQLHAGLRRAPHRGGRAARRGARPALSRTRAAARGGHPRSALPRQDLRLRHRRGALRRPVGPRLPPRLPRAVPARERWPDVPRIALTATATDATHREITQRLVMPDARHFVASFDRPNIQYRIVAKSDPKKQLLAFLKEEHAGDAGIVYCLSRASVEKIAEYLCDNGVQAAPVPRGARRGHARRQPVPLPAGGRPGDGGHHRLRHGHRQARRPVRRPSRPAQVRRGLLPGDRPRRA